MSGKFSGRGTGVILFDGFAYQTAYMAAQALIEHADEWRGRHHDKSFIVVGCTTVFQFFGQFLGKTLGFMLFRVGSRYEGALPISRAGAVAWPVGNQIGSFFPAFRVVEFFEKAGALF